MLKTGKLDLVYLEEARSGAEIENLEPNAVVSRFGDEGLFQLRFSK